MKKLYSDLWQTNPEHPLPGQPKVISNAYLLIGKEGNALFYNIGREAGAAFKEDVLKQIENLGGVKYRYLGHYHEASPAVAIIKKRFGARLCSHINEVQNISKVAKTSVDFPLHERMFHMRGIAVIPTPGHTPGSTSYLYHSPFGKTYLFSGDTVFLDHGVWRSGYLPGESNKSDLKKSLEILQALKPDVVFPAAAIGNSSFREVSINKWISEIDKAIRRLSNLPG